MLEVESFSPPGGGSSSLSFLLALRNDRSQPGGFCHSPVSAPAISVPGENGTSAPYIVRVRTGDIVRTVPARDLSSRRAGDSAIHYPTDIGGHCFQNQAVGIRDYLQGSQRISTLCIVILSARHQECQVQVLGGNNPKKGCR